MFGVCRLIWMHLWLLIYKATGMAGATVWRSPQHALWCVPHRESVWSVGAAGSLLMRPTCLGASSRKTTDTMSLVITSQAVQVRSCLDLSVLLKMTRWCWIVPCSTWPLLVFPPEVEAVLKRKTAPSLFGADMEELSFHAEMQTENRLRFKVC